MCSLYTTARKTNLSPMRFFYGIIDSAALNAFVIFTENVPNFGEHKKEKGKKFLQKLALALIIPHARQRFEVQQTPQDVEQVIRSCGILPAPSPAPSTTQRHSAQRKTCYICPRSKDRKSNSSVMSAIILCSKSTAKVTNDRSKR